MKLECSRKEFAEALGLAGSATSVRTSLQILQTVLLEATPSSLRLVGCDGEMWAERKILANVEVPGSICVQSQLLQQLVSALPDGQLSLEHDGTTLFMRFGHSEWKLLALPSEDFPEVPDVAGNAELRQKMKDLRDAVDGVSFAVADDSSRPVLTGVLFRYDGSYLTLVATDTHRLAVVKRNYEGIGSNVDAIVPGKALKAIKSMPIGDEEEIVLRFDENRLGVDSGEARVVTQLLMGVYPNWERVVPSEHTRTWTVQRDEMIENVNRAMILAKDSANRVRFSGKDESIVISVRSDDKGEAKEEVGAICNDGNIDIAFNGRYVLDALKSIRGEGIRAELTEPARPAVFRAVDGQDEQFCVIMPMQLN